MQRPVLLGAAAFGATIALGAVLFVARRERADPARCPPGLEPHGFRCCAPGQKLDRGQCSSAPLSCPDRLAKTERGCVATPERVRIAGGSLVISPSDWEAEGVVARTITVPPFDLDALEVTRHHYGESGEPGLPVVRVTPAAAEEFCRARGGRLPTADEWLFAAAGSAARRFPWGPTGLVCRRASFGLVDGPCATGATGPELAGARPDGRSPDGVSDLSGNVAEWARLPDGSVRAHGGSFRSRVAGELKSWSTEGGEAPADHVGFRCAYPAAQH